MRSILIAACLALAAGAALAQSTAPSDNKVIPGYNSGGQFVPCGATGCGPTSVTKTLTGVTPTITNGTVTTGGTFQSVLAANASRQGCFIINLGTNPGKVFSGTTGTSHGGYLPLSPGQVYPCAGSQTVDQGNIDYTSTTTGDAWAVWTW
jgi:energy-coupling factor transporter ATP-binding protein EcfA2